MLFIMLHEMKITLFAILTFITCSVDLCYSEKDINFTIHSDPENKFYLKVPKGWIPAAEDSEAVVYIIVETPLNNPVNSLNVQRIPVSFPGEEQPKVAIDLLARQLMDDLSTAEHFSINSDNYLTVNERTVREFDVNYEYNSMALRQTQAILYNNGFLYIIVYTADRSVYNSEIYQTALHSFEFIQ